MTDDKVISFAVMNQRIGQNEQIGNFEVMMALDEKSRNQSMNFK